MLQSSDTDNLSPQIAETGTPTPALGARWSAVGVVGIGAFALVTTEFLPVGLLPQIARDLAISEGQAGLMVTIPGAFAALAAPLTLAVAGRIDRRYVLLTLMGLLVVANLLVAYANDLFMLMAGRILLGVTIGAFWTVAGALGPRMRPGKDAARATSVIFSGISLGTVAGVPAGTLIGQLIGWRDVFLAAAAIALLVAVALLKLLPALPPPPSAGLSAAVASLRVKGVRLGLLVVGLIFAGQFAAYTYIAPFLTSVPRIAPSQLSAVLLGYGLAGFSGNLFGGWAAARSVKGAFVGMSLLIGIGVTLLFVLGSSAILAIAAMVGWGIGFGMLPVTGQSLLLSADPGRAEGVSALLVTTLQAAIGIGALIGGLALDDLGVYGPLWIGAGAALLGAGLTLAYQRKA